MSRCVFYFGDNNYVNIEADEFHEDEGFLKAYQHNELVGMFKIDEVKAAYRTEREPGKHPNTKTTNPTNYSK